MAKSDSIAKLLETFQPDEDTVSERFSLALNKLPKTLRDCAIKVLDVDESDEDEDDFDPDENRWERHQQLEQEKSAATVTFDKLSAADRKKIFRCCTPHLADWIELAWQHLKGSSYSISYTQRPFRAPKLPSATLDSRRQWLLSFIRNIERYDVEQVTVQWLAQWAPHAFTYEAQCVAPVLIVAMNSRAPVGDEIFEILRQSVTREHAIGRMGGHAIHSLLGSNREAGWELMEKTLLAASRQEGLRQSILDAVDTAHPDVFPRMLRVVLNNNLVRFSSVARSINVWFGLAWDSVSTKVLQENVESVLELLESSSKRKQAIASDDPEKVFRGLWASAFYDAGVTIPLAKKLLKHKLPEHRFVAVWILKMIGIEAAEQAKLFAIKDESLEVACLAAFGAQGVSLGDEAELLEVEIETADESLFELLEQLYHRLPEKPTKLKAMVWPWTERKVDRRWIADGLTTSLGKRPPTRLLPYLDCFDSWEKREVIELLAKQKKWDTLTRETLFELAGSASKDVREAAFDAIGKKTPSDNELLQLEGFLSRKSPDLRLRAIEMLAKTKDKTALASAERLANAGNKNQRLAGLELARQLAQTDRVRQECLALANDFREANKKLNKEELLQLTAIEDSGAPALSLDDALGLMDPGKLTPRTTPQRRPGNRITKAAIACIFELDDLIHKHRATIVHSNRIYGDNESPLGSLSGYELPHLRFNKSLKPQQSKFPLYDIWSDWQKNRSAKAKDKDGMELVRAWVALTLFDDWQFNQVKRWAKKPANKKRANEILGVVELPKKTRYLGIIRRIVEWLFWSDLKAGGFKGLTDYLLDCWEDSMALITPAEMQKLLEPPRKPRDAWSEPKVDDWRDDAIYHVWSGALSSYLNVAQPKLTKQQQRRKFELDWFHDEPIPGAPRQRLGIIELGKAFQAKYVNRDDLIDNLLGPKRAGYGTGFEQLTRLTQRPKSKEIAALLTELPVLNEIVDGARERILDIELARGEAETVATDCALALESVIGVENLFRVLTMIGKSKLKVASYYDRSADRLSTLTHLLRVTYPAPNDDAKVFVRLAKQAVASGAIEESRILQLAFIAPQWTKFVEAFLKWDGFSEGLYWFIAHMSTWQNSSEQAAAAAEGLEDDPESEEYEDFDDQADDESDSIAKPQRLSAWERLVLERTPLTADQRSEGAVDVEWFHRTWDQLGKQRWQQMAEAARYAANSAQAKKAQFLADVLLGNTTRKTLVDGIKQKNLKQNVRLLGLLPLANGKSRDKDIVERYRVLQDYKKYARKLSGLTKPEALRAAEIGFENLARIAGFPDPLRLEWAMEADSVKDLAQGPVAVTKDGVTVTLALDDDAKPQLTIARGEKRLKSIPAATRKKHAAIAELADRAKELKRSAGLIKKSLESAMCRGDVILGCELKQLFAHAILAPQLARLVLIGEGIMGYPDKGGKALRDHRGKLEPVKSNESLRIAHPVDLLASKQWSGYQRECFQSERVQPFKQVFRELYIVTSQEKKDGKRSSRFAGQQVGPRQAMALLGSRGWNTQEDVFRVFHKESLVAGIDFQYNFGTAAEIEGLTMETVSFRRRDVYEPIKLTDVPKRLFSEVMRDVDLVVSVAHRGEVDPEASASTIEMRTLLVEETCQLLGLKNVKLSKSHAIINGYYGKYSLHLGSGNIQRLPGGALSIVAVQSQHRGRVFLPFADDDPRTAEVISKVLLLARDEEIQDPLILDQLGAPVGKRSRVKIRGEEAPKSAAMSGGSKVNSKAGTKTNDSKSRPSKSKSRRSAAVSSGPERYELSDGKSNKFWEISLSGTELTTKWGRIGSDGQSKTKSFADEESAKAEYQKLVSAKTSKGYKLDS